MLAAETNVVAIPQATGSPPKSSVEWEEILEAADPFLKSVGKRLIAQAREFEPEILPFAEYALSSNGKQLRPLLVWLSGSASGKINDDHVAVAVIIEMVHLATLVHDDIMDEADLRRNRRTASREYGAEAAVLLGDALFSHALNLATQFPTTEVCAAVSESTRKVSAIMRRSCRRLTRLSSPT